MADYRFLALKMFKLQTNSMTSLSQHS